MVEKEAVAASRDQLAAVLTMLARTADGDATVIAHSTAKLEIVDVSSVKAHDRTNHERYATLAALYPRRAAADADGTAVRHAGAFVFSAVGTTISSFFTLASRAIGGR